MTTTSSLVHQSESLEKEDSRNEKEKKEEEKQEEKNETDEDQTQTPETVPSDGADNIPAKKCIYDKKQLLRLPIGRVGVGIHVRFRWHLNQVHFVRLFAGRCHFVGVHFRWCSNRFQFCR